MNGDTTYCVYIMTNRARGTLYVGVTNNLEARTYEHATGTGSAFTKKHKLTQLVYYEEFNDIRNAINREKRLKKWNRQWKMDLIEQHNPQWKDLSYGWHTYNP